MVSDLAFQSVLSFLVAKAKKGTGWVTEDVLLDTYILTVCTIKFSPFLEESSCLENQDQA